MPPKTALAHACIQKTLVAGTCASQRFLVAFFMRRYVSACGAASAVSAGCPFSTDKSNTPPLATMHPSEDRQALRATE